MFQTIWNQVSLLKTTKNTYDTKNVLSIQSSVIFTILFKFGGILILSKVYLLFALKAKQPWMRKGRFEPFWNQEAR